MLPNFGFHVIFFLWDMREQMVIIIAVKTKKMVVGEIRGKGFGRNE